MPLTSDITLDASKFRREDIDPKTKAFNERLIKIWEDGPRWTDVSFLIQYVFDLSSLASIFSINDF